MIATVEMVPLCNGHACQSMNSHLELYCNHFEKIVISNVITGLPRM